ncbi:hypothetical protein [Psittacicella gerlachiana]|uniref:Uncharacterized protein n=1 Tax=Psittacicella gerlachiana TaxID=2028574 RepID=A0A3A1YBT9_9GAMM|nr:hypothetical protein [Psittacicella gerlachiana]RIY34640.1 hypothetical protein CKF59_05200 [Psittacicella gerlachiana]
MLNKFLAPTLKVSLLAVLLGTGFILTSCTQATNPQSQNSTTYLSSLVISTSEWNDFVAARNRFDIQYRNFLHYYDTLGTQGDFTLSHAEKENIKAQIITLHEDLNSFTVTNFDYSYGKVTVSSEHVANIYSLYNLINALNQMVGDQVLNAKIIFSPSRFIAPHLDQATYQQMQQALATVNAQLGK